MSLFRIPTAALLCLLALSGAAIAQDRSLQITEFGVYDLAAGVDSMADSFLHEDADALGLHALLDISGLEQGRTEKLDLFLAVFSEEDADRRRPLLKEKRTEKSGNGSFAVEFTEFMDADAWFGECRFTVVLEATLKGARGLKRELEFRIEGPRMPAVSFEEISVYSWERGPGYEDLEPGEEFLIDVLVSVDGNETGLDPRLRLLAVMEDDLWYMDPEDPYMGSGPNWSEAWLRGGNGEWRVYVRGRMPLYFESPYDYYRDYRIYAFVSFGDNPQRESDYVSKTLIDPDNGELRQNDNVLERLVEVSQAGHWMIRQTRTAGD